MLTFKSFLILIEANLSASGKDVEYHTQKYIAPFIGSGQSDTHTLSKDHHDKESGVSLKAGDKLTIHGYEDIKGKRHAIVSPSGSSEKVKIPYTSIAKPKDEEGEKKKSYNDEHAFVKMWNFATNKGITSHEDLHKELEKARIDPTHELHMTNASNEGFSGGRKTDDHADSYHNELHTAATTISQLLDQNAEFRKAHANKDVAVAAGAKKIKGLSNVRWTGFNYGSKKAKPDTTSKTDIKIGNNIRISYKKGGGSQLMSAEPNELYRTYMVSAHKAHADGLMSEDHINDVDDSIRKINGHLEDMKGKSSEEKEDLKNKAQKIADEMHERHPHLFKYVAHEAATGEHKLEGSESGVANYLVSSSHNGKNAKVSNITTDGLSRVYLGGLRIAMPKGSSRVGNAKIDIFDSPKKERKVKKV